MVLSVRAEKSRAIEVARSAAQQSADVLRLYDTALFRPEETSARVLFGSHFTPEEHAFVPKNGVLVWAEKHVVEVFPHLRLSRADLTDFMALGLPVWHDLLINEHRNEFEEAALMSLALFTRSATEHELSDRLLYAFAGLESLLLKDTQAPVTQNIADRLALAIEATPEKRLEMVKTVKDTYAARSHFVHHGGTPDDILLIRRFLEIAWQFYVGRLPQALREFTRKRDFVESLDRMKY